MTFGKLRESWKGGRDSPGWNRHIALGRAPRSSEFPVINYGVDDRVPSLFLPLSLHPPFAPSPAPLFLLILFLLLRPRASRPPFPINDGSSLSFSSSFFLPLPLTRNSRSLSSTFFFFIHLTASRKRYTAYRDRAFEPRVVPIHKTVDPRHVHHSRVVEPPRMERAGTRGLGYFAGRFRTLTLNWNLI